MSPVLHLIGINTRCTLLDHHARAGAVPSVVVDVFEVEGVDVAGEEAVERGGDLAWLRRLDAWFGCLAGVVGYGAMCDGSWGGRW